MDTCVETLLGCLRAQSLPHLTRQQRAEIRDLVVRRGWLLQTHQRSGRATVPVTGVIPQTAPRIPVPEIVARATDQTVNQIVDQTRVSDPGPQEKLEFPQVPSDAVPLVVRQQPALLVGEHVAA